MDRMVESQFVTAARRPVRTAPTRAFLLSAGVALGAGAALRIWMLSALFEVNGDSLVYGGIAKNLLLQGRYALTTATGITYPTLIRLPGYPLFLVLCFRLFGMENYFAAVCVQIVAELAGCALLAGFARRIARGVRPDSDAFAQRAGLATLWIGALCPFTASYSVRAMAETLTLAAIALAMYAMASFYERPGWSSALSFTFAVTCATLLRPDGALVAVAFVPGMLIALARPREVGTSPTRATLIVVCVVLALAPFAAWSWRNWRVFHIFQPLAPRLAVDPGESTNPGWERWVKSWCLDFVSTYEIYWNVPDDVFDVRALPGRAFDSPAQIDETAAIARDYNAGAKKLTAAIDARFGRLADERIATHPLRSDVWLPVGRMLDMWLRPRNEDLPVDLDWWNFERHQGQTIFAWVYITLNAAYLVFALLGLWLRPRFWKAIIAYIFLRSALLLTVEAPEARYTLECFPMIFVLAGVAIAALVQHGQRNQVSQTHPTPSVSSVTGIPTRE